MTDRVLTPSQVAALRVLWRQPEDGSIVPDDMGRALASHELLRAERDLLRAEVRAWRELDWERWPTLQTPDELLKEREEYQATLDALAAARAATDRAHALDKEDGR